MLCRYYYTDEKVKLESNRHVCVRIKPASRILLDIYRILMLRVRKMHYAHEQQGQCRASMEI